MNSKVKVIFFCTSCGNEFSRWNGQCSSCKEWNTIIESPNRQKSFNTRKNSKPRTPNATNPLQAITVNDVNLIQQPRISTTISEFDLILGGGITNGSVILIGGDPGVGKSTLLTQVMAQISQQNQVLYVSGEESLPQISQRAKRLSIPLDKLWLFSSTDIGDVIEIANKHQPKIMVVDSIQSVYSDNLNSNAGSITQVRECCSQLIEFAKSNHCAVFIVGHVTKDGHIAGPRLLEHMVDTVLYLEGEKEPRYRMLRVIKNRFGSVNELAVFAMTEKGMQQVKNPSAIFLVNRGSDVTGSVVSATKEGSRAILIEIQALTDNAYERSARRIALGLDFNRLAMLLAIIHRHTGISTFDIDCYINIVGGLKIQETSTDLAVILAIISSIKNKPIDNDTVIFGEIGLTGEIRPVADGESRIIEAQKQGFKKAIVPATNVSKTLQKKSTINIIGVKTILQAISSCRL